MARFDIEEILFEAHALGIRREVIKTAGYLLDNNTFYDLSEAYEAAFQHCVNQVEQNETETTGYAEDPFISK